MPHMVDEPAQPMTPKKNKAKEAFKRLSVHCRS